MSWKWLAIDWNLSIAAFVTSNKTIETCQYKNQKSFQFCEETVRKPIRSKAIQCKNSTLSIEIGKKI